MYYSADFLGALRTIAIVLLVIYGLRFIAKLLAPWMMRKAQSKIQNMAEEQMRGRGFSNNSTQQKPEGSVTVQSVDKKKRKGISNNSDDEYVDYEVVE